MVGEHPAQRARHATRLPAAGPRMRAAADGGGGRLLRGVSSAPGGDRREQRQQAGLRRGSPHPQPYLPSSTGKQRLFRHFPAFVFWFLADWTSPVLATTTPVLHRAQSAGAADIALRAQLHSLPHLPNPFSHSKHTVQDLLVTRTVLTLYMK